MEGISINTYSNRFFWLTIASLFLSCAFMQPLQAQETREFSIPAGPLGVVLSRFAADANVVLSFDAALTEGESSAGLQGRYTVSQAFEFLLAGRGIKWTENRPGIWVLNRDEPLLLTGAVLLSPIRVSATSDPVTEIYRTPGSVNVVTREQLDRVPVVSARDVFASTPGVWVRDGRQDPAMEINIRGVQGPGRIAVTLDGARQDTSSYFGYSGMKSRVYVDPELLGGVDIEKGPTSGAGGAGQIGGTVAFRTLGADDLIKGDNWQGYRLRTIGGDNGTDYAHSAAGAWRLGSERNIDIAAGVSTRRNGQYRAGTKDPNMTRKFIDPSTGEDKWVDLMRIQPGAKVPHVYLDSLSAFVKGKGRFGDGHEVELGTTYYDSDYASASIGLNPTVGKDGSNTELSTYTLRHHWLPESNDWIDLNSSLWHTRSDVTRINGVRNETRTWGFEIWNGTRLDNRWFDTELSYGVEYRHNDMDAFSTKTGAQRKIGNVVGEQTVAGGFINAKLNYRGWLELRPALRYDTYNLKGNGAYASYLAGQAPLTPFVMDRGDSRLNPALTIAVQPWRGVQFYAAYTEGMRPPSIGESLFTGQYFAEFLPNPFLEPEIARNRELGLNLLRNGLLVEGDTAGFKFAVFDNRYDNYIERRTVRWPGATGIGASGYGEQSVNLDSARFRGGELNLYYSARFLFFDLGYSYFSFMEYCENGSCDSQRYGATASRGGATVAPEYKIAGTLGTRLWNQRLTLGVRGRHESERMLKEDTAAGIDSRWSAATLWDAFGNLKLMPWLDIGFSIENLQDKYYIDPISSDVVPAPGRTFKAMLTATF